MYGNNLSFINDLKNISKVYGLKEADMAIDGVLYKYEKLKYDPVNRTINKYAREQYLKQAILVIGLEIDERTVYKTTPILEKDYLNNDLDCIGELEVKTKLERIDLGGSQYIITKPFNIYGDILISIEDIIDRPLELTDDIIYDNIKSTIFDYYNRYSSDKDFIINKIEKNNLDLKPKFTIQLRFINNIDSPINILYNPKESSIILNRDDKIKIRCYGNQEVVDEYKDLLYQYSDTESLKREAECLHNLTEWQLNDFNLPKFDKPKKSAKKIKIFNGNKININLVGGKV